MIIRLFLLELLLGKVGFLDCLVKLLNGQIGMPVLCIFESFGLKLFVGLVVVLDDIDWVFYCLS